ncbi:MAG: hypothetical protein ABIR80_06975 [Opitutaceae bacterium]
MPSLKKNSLVVGLAILAAGFGWYQIRLGRRQSAEIAELTQRTTHQRHQIQRLRVARDALPAHTTDATPTPSSAFATGDATFDARMDSTLARVNQLRKWLRENPTQKLPEFEFLTDTDWIEVVSAQSRRARAARSETDASAEAAEEVFKVRDAARDLRLQAKLNFASLLHGALKSYAEANAGRLPPDFAQLAPFFVHPIPDAVLQRYELRASGPVEAVPAGLPIIGEKTEALAGTSDAPFAIYPNGRSGSETFEFGDDSSLNPFELSPEMTLAIGMANQAYRMAHDGTRPHDPAQLLPYFENPSLAAEFAENRSANETMRKATDEGRQGYAAANPGRELVNREDILPYIRDLRVRTILAAKDAYLKDRGEHSIDSASLRPYVKDPAARELLEKVIRAESGRREQ